MVPVSLRYLEQMRNWLTFNLRKIDTCQDNTSSSWLPQRGTPHQRRWYILSPSERVSHTRFCGSPRLFQVQLHSRWQCWTGKCSKDVTADSGERFAPSRSRWHCGIITRRDFNTARVAWVRGVPDEWLLHTSFAWTFGWRGMYTLDSFLRLNFPYWGLLCSVAKSRNRSGFHARQWTGGRLISLRRACKPSFFLPMPIWSVIAS